MCVGIPLQEEKTFSYRKERGETKKGKNLFFGKKRIESVVVYRNLFIFSFP